ncbi:hypothetical protein C8R47DRAFT_1066102 [Mycena vitilis]|nr:hypothetical protein C8R47DRAFT_1066102 [Mycena vitilis]
MDNFLAVSTRQKRIVVTAGVDVDRYLGAASGYKVTADDRINLREYFQSAHCWDGWVLYGMGHTRHYAIAVLYSTPKEVLLARQRIALEQKRGAKGHGTYCPRPLDEFLASPSETTLHDFLAEPLGLDKKDAVIQYGFRFEHGDHPIITTDSGLQLERYFERTHCWIGNTLYALEINIPPVTTNRTTWEQDAHYWYAPDDVIPFEVQEARLRLGEDSGGTDILYKLCFLYEFLAAPRHVTLAEFQSVLRPTPFWGAVVVANTASHPATPATQRVLHHTPGKTRNDLKIDMLPGSNVAATSPAQLTLSPNKDGFRATTPDQTSHLSKQYQFVMVEFSPAAPKPRARSTRTNHRLKEKATILRTTARRARLPANTTPITANGEGRESTAAASCRPPASAGAAPITESRTVNDSRDSVAVAKKRKVVPSFMSYATAIAQDNFTADPGIDLRDYFVRGNVKWDRITDSKWTGWVVYPLDSDLAPLKMRDKDGGRGGHFSLLHIRKNPSDVQTGRYVLRRIVDRPRETTDALKVRL